MQTAPRPKFLIPNRRLQSVQRPPKFLNPNRNTNPRTPSVQRSISKRSDSDHPDQIVAHSLFKEAIGTASDDFCHGLLSQMSEFVGLDETKLNFLLSVIITGKPKDEFDTMFLYQQGVTLCLQTQFTRYPPRIEIEFSAVERDLRDPKLSHMINEKNYSPIENLLRLMDSTVNGFSKLVRTNCTLVDALDRHRTSGEPSTTVHLAPVGQAIVGNITHAASSRTAPNNLTAGPRALTDQQHSAMPIIGEPDRVAVPARRRKKTMTSNHPRNTT